MKTTPSCLLLQVTALRLKDAKVTAQVTQLSLDPDLTLKHLLLTSVARTHLPAHLDLWLWWHILVREEQDTPSHSQVNSLPPWQFTHTLSPVVYWTVSFECSPKPTPPLSLAHTKSFSFIQTLTFFGFDHGITVIQSARCETTKSCLTNPSSSPPCSQRNPAFSL